MFVGTGAPLTVALTTTGHVISLDVRFVADTYCSSAVSIALKISQKYFGITLLFYLCVYRFYL